MRVPMQHSAESMRDFLISTACDAGALPLES